MLHPTAQPATRIPPPTRPDPGSAAPPAAFTAAGGLRVLVTDTPAAAGAAHACTPAMAAWLIGAGAAVALVDEDAGDGRQWLHLPPRRDRKDQAQEDRVGLVEELYAERFASGRVA